MSPKATDLVPSAAPGRISARLALVAELVQRVADRVVDVDHRPDPAVDLGELGDDRQVLAHGQPGAAVTLRHQQPEGAHLPQRRPDLLAGDRLGVLDLLDDGRDVAPHPGDDLLAEILVRRGVHSSPFGLARQAPSTSGLAIAPLGAPASTASTLSVAIRDIARLDWALIPPQCGDMTTFAQLRERAAAGRLDREDVEAGAAEAALR